LLTTADYTAEQADMSKTAGADGRLARRLTGPVKNESYYTILKNVLTRHFFHVILNL
jgi:hypothetical protein